MKVIFILQLFFIYFAISFSVFRYSFIVNTVEIKNEITSAIGSADTSAEERRRSDKRNQQFGDGQSGQKDSQGTVSTGWELERQDYYNGQIRQGENKNLAAQNDTDTDTAAKHSDIDIDNLDLPSSNIIENDSDDYDLRECQRRAKQNLNATAYAMDEIAKLIIESKSDYTNDEGTEFTMTM